MKILMGFNSGGTVGIFLKRGFESLGHEVITVGMGHEGNQPDLIYGPGLGYYIYNAERICKEQGCDFVLSVEPSVYFSSLSELSVPNAMALVDSYVDPYHFSIKPLGGPKYLKMVDFIFTAKIPHIGLWKRMGYKAHHLPLAYDPSCHHPMDREKLYDIVFVGRTEVYPERMHLFNVLREANFSIWVGSRSLDEYCEKIAEGRIALNSSHEGEMNMRFFELLGMGALQLSNIVLGQDSLGFYPQQHLINYSTDINLVDICRSFVDNDEAREIVANAGYEKAKTHTYKHRAQEILNVVFGEGS